jgi:hypothetical protein
MVTVVRWSNYPFSHIGCLGYDTTYCDDQQRSAGTFCFHLQGIIRHQYLPSSIFRLQGVADFFEMYKTTRSINRRIAIQSNLAVEWAAVVLCPESSASYFGRRLATLAQFYWFSPLRTAKFGTHHNRTLLHSCTALFTNHRAIWHCTVWATDILIQTELTWALIVLHTTADMFVHYFHNSTMRLRTISRVRNQSFGDPSVTIIRIDRAGPKHRF